PIFRPARDEDLSKPPSVSVVEDPETSAADFYRDFVLPRRPCILRGPLKGTDKAFIDNSFTAIQDWTNSYLRRMAGSCEVFVERRAPNRPFGSGNRERMTFTNLLTAIENGDEDLYLTAQPGFESDTGPYSVVNRPLASPLLLDIPLRPRVMGHLTPFLYNLWMGNSASGSSTGLHHDFHDNLYVVIRGRKQFRLLSPRVASFLDTVDQFTDVHPNGLITYSDTGETRDDGASVEVTRRKLSRMLKKEGQLLKARMAQRKSSDLTDPSEQEIVENGFKFWLSEVGRKKSSWKCPEKVPDETYKKPVLCSPSKSPSHFCRRNTVTRTDSQERSVVKGVHFTRQKPWKNIESKYMQVDLEPGDVLYLPAGWFHEVFSHSDPNSGDDKPGHLAVNYWYHPPSSAGTVEEPYEDLFWPCAFKEKWDRLVSSLDRLQHILMLSVKLAALLDDSSKRSPAVNKTFKELLKSRALVENWLCGPPLTLEDLQVLDEESESDSDVDVDVEFSQGRPSMTTASTVRKGVDSSTSPKRKRHRSRSTEPSPKRMKNV
ncbi:MAG: hypothetical protein KVP17_004158, partial [Porospora cf. gigantea B]|uniref:uncharacterized protein n=2 Tax=Porospora cf. gigantea B TaxID=2853592 RepID=UPI003571ED45